MPIRLRHNGNWYWKKSRTYCPECGHRAGPGGTNHEPDCPRCHGTGKQAEGEKR